MQILVIEDNPDLVANMCDFLETRGHGVDVAYDAWNGLRLATEQHHDTIILDLMLPGLDGIEVCTRLRDAGKDVPVLMLTARDTLQDKLKGFSSGADDYMVKPFALQELEARITALVRRARGEQVQRRLCIADLVYEPDLVRLRRDGRGIELPPIQLKILELLMRESPRVVPRAEIERLIWGDKPPDSDALRAHMHLLRNAIDKTFEQPLLRTVRGMGYQLADPNALPA